MTKKQVDNFIEGRVTPCCWLKAEFKGMEVSNLKHQVNIQGAKYPHNIFIIDLPAEGSYYKSNTSSSETTLASGFVSIQYSSTLQI